MSMGEKKLHRLSQFSSDLSLINETVRFLQACIRIDTSNPPGNEMVLAKFIQEKFENEKNPLITSKIIETGPNRGNLIITIKGSQSSSYPTWGFFSHLDVVPAGNKETWQYPPFSGELVKMEHDKFIWGRGAMDMKQIGVSHSMAIITLLREGFQPKGDIKLIFEADEERGGEEGIKILIEDHWEDIKVDCMITESGGYKLPTGRDFAIQIGEKGKCQTKIITTGSAGHGSTPGDLNKFAIYKLVAILEKIRKTKSKLYIIQEYKNTVNSASLPLIFKFLLKRKSILRGLLRFFSKITGDPFSKFFLPMITDTIAPTIIRGGSKVNVISPHAELSLDIRTLPNHDHDFIYDELKNIIGDKYFNGLKLEPINESNSTTSPIKNEFYDLIAKTLDEIYPGGNLVPIFDTGGTDMKHMRPKGVPCYGFSLLLKDPDLSYNDLVNMSHAPDERISVRNLMLATEFMYRLMKKL